MENIKILRGHQLPVTCVVVSHDNKYIFSASKDGTIIKCMYKNDWLWEGVCSFKYENSIEYLVPKERA